MTHHPHTQAQLRAEGVQTRDFAAGAVVNDRNESSPAASLLRCIMDRETIRLGRQRERAFPGDEGVEEEPIVDAQEIITPKIVVDADSHSLISIASVEAISVALEAADGGSTPSGAWNNHDFSELSSADSSDGNGDDGSSAVSIPTYAHTIISLLSWKLAWNQRLLEE